MGMLGISADLEGELVQARKELEEERAGRAADVKLREQWLQDSRDQTAEAWAAR